jgi:hypothetical protein
LKATNVLLRLTRADLTEFFTNAEEATSGSSEKVVVACSDTTENTRILSGAYEASDFIDRFQDLDTDTADALATRTAELENYRIDDEAALALTSLHSVANLSRLSELLEDGAVDEQWVMENMDQKLTFENGRYIYLPSLLNDTDQVRIIRLAVLNGLEHYGCAKSLMLSLEEQGFARSLTITKEGSEIIDISYTAKLTEDPLYMRSIELLGVEGVKVIMKVALTSSQEEMDDYFYKLWQEQLGSSKELEIAGLIEDLRERFMSLQQSKKLSLLSDAKTPSAENLEEFALSVE